MLLVACKRAAELSVLAAAARAGALSAGGTFDAASVARIDRLADFAMRRLGLGLPEVRKPAETRTWPSTQELIARNRAGAAR
jgi:hypothetical protein